MRLKTTHLEHSSVKAGYFLRIRAELDLLPVVFENDVIGESFVLGRKHDAAVLQKPPFGTVGRLFLFPPLPYLNLGKKMDKKECGM